MRNNALIHFRRLSYPAVILLMVLYVLPLGLLLLSSVSEPTWGWDNYRRILTQPGYLWTLGRTLGLAAASTSLALLIGYPLAYVIATTPRVWLRYGLIFCIATPYLTSILIRTFAWQVLLGRIGLVTQGLEAVGLGTLNLMFNATAVIIGLTHFLLPLMVLPLVSVMRKIDLTLLRASSSLGAGRATGFVRIFIPNSLPGIEVGVVLCFVYGVGAFVTPALLGGNSGRMLGALIESAISQQADYGLAAAASILLALAVTATVVLFRRGLGGGTQELVSPELASHREAKRQGLLLRGTLAVLAGLARRLDTSGLSRLPGLSEGYALLVALLVLLPQLVAIPISLSSTRTLIFPPPGWSTQWYRNFFLSDWLDALGTSLQIALATTLAATVIGAMAALGVVRGLAGRRASIAQLLLICPLIFPSVIAAAAFFLVGLPLSLTDTRLGIVLAHFCVAMPFVFVIVSANVRMLDPSLERAAASLGAGTWEQLRRVMLPLLSGSLISGAFFAFLASFDEASISIFLSGLHVKTLPRRMYEALQMESDPTVGVAAVLAMLATALAMLAYAGLARRRAAPFPT